MNIKIVFDIFRFEKLNKSVFIEPNNNANATVKTKQIKAIIITVKILEKIGLFFKNLPPYVTKYNIYL